MVGTRKKGCIFRLVYLDAEIWIDSIPIGFAHGVLLSKILSTLFFSLLMEIEWQLYTYFLGG